MEREEEELDGERGGRSFFVCYRRQYRYHLWFKKHHPTKVVIMPLKECIHNLTHSLLQRGAPKRRRGYGATPNPTKDITTSSSVDRRKIQSDSQRQPFTTSPTATVTGYTSNTSVCYYCLCSPLSTSCF